MNWYKQANIKIASVSFWIDGLDKISKPMHKLNICSDLHNFIWYNLDMGKELGVSFSDIDPDISEGGAFDPLGRINIYVQPGTDPKTERQEISRHGGDEGLRAQLYLSGGQPPCEQIGSQSHDTWAGKRRQGGCFHGEQRRNHRGVSGHRQNRDHHCADQFQAGQLRC